MNCFCHGLRPLISTSITEADADLCTLGNVYSLFNGLQLRNDSINEAQGLGATISVQSSPLKDIILQAIKQLGSLYRVYVSLCLSLG
jgi:hypothetical protein